MSVRVEESKSTCLEKEYVNKAFSCKNRLICERIRGFKSKIKNIFECGKVETGLKKIV